MANIINKIPRYDTSLIPRFMEKVEKTTKCWNFNHSLSRKGYGKIHVKISKRKYVGSHSHRISYIIFKGNIPEGMTVHHKCNNKMCVNPKHLELKTNEQNRLLGNCWSAVNSRKTHCPKGHPFSGKNLYTYQRLYKNRTITMRGCKECRKRNTRDWRMKEKLNPDRQPGGS